MVRSSDLNFLEVTSSSMLETLMYFNLEEFIKDLNKLSPLNSFFSIPLTLYSPKFPVPSY